MSGQLHNNNSRIVNQNRIVGYLDTLLVDHSLWDEKLSLAMNPPVRPLDTIAKGKYLLTTECFGSGTRKQKYIHLLNALSLVRQLPVSRLKNSILHRCLPLAAEAMPCD
ncbi:MAG: hypothetical protein JKY50_05110 [Oleispira sp.]|nr:hypothetical protein [Oleispira sp.]